MDPVRSSLAAGAVATVTLFVWLFVADALLAGEHLFVFATFTSLCAIGGPPYCEPTGLGATVVTLVWFALLFGAAWPLLFAGFTWGLPGESGLAHGVVFALVLWAGYVPVALYSVSFGGGIADNATLLAVTLASYLLYGIVLGGFYDTLAHHRTLLSQEEENVSQ